jgi:hypothetical protein
MIGLDDAQRDAVAILAARAPWPRLGVINVSRTGISRRDIDHTPLAAARAKGACDRVQITRNARGCAPSSRNSEAFPRVICTPLTEQPHQLSRLKSLRIVPV